MLSLIPHGCASQLTNGRPTVDRVRARLLRRALFCYTRSHARTDHSARNDTLHEPVTIARSKSTDDVLLRVLSNVEFTYRYRIHEHPFELFPIENIATTHIRARN